MKHLKKQKGFTIIELVVVILLLGILTATALPRFMDVTDEAHGAVVSAVVGGLTTGNALFRSQWYAESQPRTVTEFNSLRANTQGYPVGLKTGATTTLLASVGTSANCQEIFESLLQPGGRPTITAKTQTATALSGTTTVPTGFDFVSYLRTGTTALANVCHYIYTGQTTDNALNSLPVIQYDATTGANLDDKDLIVV